MKFAFVLPIAAIVIASSSFAQARIWRCGNSYTNDQVEAQAKSCKLVEGGNVTVVSGTKVQGANSSASASAGVKLASAPLSTPRVDTGEQRARDSEAREILEAELKKAEIRFAGLQKEWNNGEPEKLGPEHRNHQKYLDRVAELKANLTRSETDIVNIKRELGRAK